MAPVPSRPVNSSDVHVLQQRGPPPIPFKGIALNPASNTRDLFVTISLRTDPDNMESGTFEQKVQTFSQGTAEDYIRWRMAFDEVVVGRPLTTGQSKILMTSVLLGGAAKDLFKLSVLKADVEDVDIEELSYLSALDTLNKRYTPLDGLAKQKAYMRYQLRLSNLGIKPFEDRLLELNNYLAYFPAGDRSSMLPGHELIKIIDRAKPIEWHVAMLTANI